jgi:hypothetical protein
MRRLRNNGDPKVMRSKYNSKCCGLGCGISIRKGQLIYYWPNKRKAYCEKCGEPDYKTFVSIKEDETFYQTLSSYQYQII